MFPWLVIPASYASEFSMNKVGLELVWLLGDYSTLEPGGRDPFLKPCYLRVADWIWLRLDLVFIFFDVRNSEPRTGTSIVLFLMLRVVELLTSFSLKAILLTMSASESVSSVRPPGIIKLRSEGLCMPNFEVKRVVFLPLIFGICICSIYDVMFNCDVMCVSSWLILGETVLAALRIEEFALRLNWFLPWYDPL
jgi:hypothetical protein